jgi:hypothetical protein
MNIRWWHSQRVLVASLVTAMLAVGVLTSLVIRQQRRQADGQIYLETGGTVNAKPGVPVIGRPTMVRGNIEGGCARPGNGWHGRAGRWQGRFPGAMRVR